MYSRIKSFKYSIVWSTVLYGIIVPPPEHGQVFCCICLPHIQWHSDNGCTCLPCILVFLLSMLASSGGGGDIFHCSSSSQNCPALYFVHQYTLLHIMHCFGAQVFQNPPFHTALNYRSNKIYSSNTNGISVKNYSYTAVYTVLFYLNNNIVAGENVRASRKKSGNQRLANLPTIINMCNPPQHCLNTDITHKMSMHFNEMQREPYKLCSYSCIVVHIF